MFKIIKKLVIVISFILATDLFASTTGVILTIIDAIPGSNYTVSENSIDSIQPGWHFENNAISLQYGSCVELSFQGYTSGFLFQLKLTELQNTNYITLANSMTNWNPYNNVKVTGITIQNLTPGSHGSSDSYTIGTDINCTATASYEPTAKNDCIMLTLMPTSNTNKVNNSQKYK